MLNRLLKIMAGGLLLFLIAAGFYLGISTIAPPKEGPGTLFPVSTNEKTVLNADNILRKEKTYLCGDTEVIYQGMVPESMWGKEISEIANEYPAEQGWVIDNTNKPLIILKRQVEDFCPEHVNFRHLGTVNNKLCVYEGPLGYDQKLLRVEETLTLDKLNPGLREALHQSKVFFEQSIKKQEQLRKQLEFKNEQSLNAALENIDEMD
ncbi:hypothetical protein [Desulfolucanica intricata]|uniref:hypothetical protein n=1 Tax=Desulfolucanica intricata TaxID=1285191 RepID=UPI0008320A3B|nr:hypothetical protein [Desulfolucanica intricata]